jgi:hypothetical protein
MSGREYGVRKKILATYFLLLYIILFPINIYVIGDFQGTGIQGIYYRMQTTTLGQSFIPITSDLRYILDGTFGLKTSLSIFIWILGVFLLTMTILYVLIKFNKLEIFQQKISGILMILSAILLIISCIIQYGFLFHGPAGIAIPFGIPLILFFGYLLFKESKDIETREIE